ncbi:MAG: TIGR03750 family conjugal transfer protein [Gammaproteobacteria bacterium]|nr:TIGR03750 family conjugal transfer protein [Gammaproteobacteria bacterium]
MSNLEVLITERLNEEPAIFKGCSLSELTWMTFGAVAIWLPICLIVAALIGSVTMGFGFGGIMVVFSVIVMSLTFRRLKTNRPHGYYQLAAHLWLARHRLIKSPFVIRSGVWDLGRT